MARVAAGGMGTGGLRLAAPIWRPLRGSASQLFALLGGAVLWEVLGRLLGLSWLPPFSDVIAALIRLIASGVILGSLAASLQVLAIGFTFSLVVGVLVGALMARYRKVELLLDVYVNAMLMAPSIVFAPIFFTIFGLSDMTRIAVVVLFTLFVIIVNTFTAIRTVDRALIEMATSFGADERRIFLRILLPAALPVIFAGIRLGMGRAVKGMINGEMFIAFVGLGALAQKYGGQFDASNVLAISLVVLVVALVANWLVQIVDRKLTSWAD
jgi:ABC-type nitrate/sulfonate/bicarbonate transport system permease component